MRQRYNLLKNWCQLYLTKENLYKVLKLYIIESTSNKMLLISSLIINMFFIYLFGLLDKQVFLKYLFIPIIIIFILLIVDLNKIELIVRIRRKIKYFLYIMLSFICLILSIIFKDKDFQDELIGRFILIVGTFLIGMLFKFFIINIFKYKNKKIVCFNFNAVFVFYMFYIFCYPLVEIHNVIVMNLINILDYIIWIFTFKIGYDYYLVRNYEINSNFINLDYYQVFSSKIYFVDLWQNFMNSKIFEIDLTNIFPIGASNCQISVLNQCYIENIVNNSSKNGRKIYFCVPIYENNSIQGFKLDAILNFIDAEIEKSFKVIIYIDVLRQGKELFIRNISVEQAYKPIKLFSPKDGLKLNRNVHDILSFLDNMYTLDVDLKEIHKEFNSYKGKDFYWVFHDDEYGNGKSTLDHILCNNEGYQVVSFSPWNVNYDNDLLLLIYEKVRQSSKKKSYRLINDMTIIWLIITLICLYNYLSIVESVKNIFDIKNINIMLVLIGGIGLVCICLRYLAQIIKYFNSSSKLYQNYFIYQILEMMYVNKIMLVIEDIDRMQYEGYYDILRICSSLNTYCNFRDRILGVISFSSKEMIELEKDKLREMNYPNDESEIEQKAVRNFNEFRKKIFKREILEEYKSSESRKKYLKEVASISYDALMHEYNDNSLNLRLRILKGLKEKEYSRIVIDFREIHDLLIDLVFTKDLNDAKLNKLKLTIEEKLGISID